MNNEQLAINNEQLAINTPPLLHSSTPPPLHPSNLPVFQSSSLPVFQFFLLLLATFLRLYLLPTLPPGLNFDEAGSGTASLDILHGEPQLWWRIGGGQEPLWPYLTAATTALLGPTPLALRLPAALIGVLTVAAVYPLMLALYRRRDVALFTMLGLAFSDWHLHFSRLGFRAILLPLLSTLALYFLWKAVLQISQPKAWSPGSVPGRNWSPASRFIILSALFTALAIYAYLAARLLPVTVLFIFVAFIIVAPKQHRPRLFFLCSSFFVHFLLFVFPLLTYFTLHPTDFTARAGTVSIFNPVWHQGNLPGAFWQTLTLTLSTFLGLSGDPNPLVNLPHQPALPLFLVPFFLIGLLSAAYQTLFSLLSPPEQLTMNNEQLTNPLLHSSSPPTFQPSNLPTFQSLLLLTWWLTMLLPALLAPEGAPHHLRLIGTLVPTYALVALGLATTMTWLSRLRHAPRPTFHVPRWTYLLPLVCYLLLAFQTSTNYFSRWPRLDFTLPFDLYAVRLAADIARTPADGAYVLPMDIRAGAEARHYTLDYLLADRPAAYTYLPVAGHNAAEILTQAAQGKTDLRVVRWTEDKHREADAKAIVTFLLATQARLIERESFPVYDLETYRLPGSETRFHLPPINQPIGVNFDGLLRLEAASVPASAAPGQALPVALTVAPTGSMAADYKASIRLVSPSGERVAQQDRVLLHDFHQGTSLWPPGPVNEYYLLPLPPEMPPGDYTVTVVLYHPETQAPLVADGLAEVPVGQVKIED